MWINGRHSVCLIFGSRSAGLGSQPNVLAAVTSTGLLERARRIPVSVLVVRRATMMTSALTRSCLRIRPRRHERARHQLRPGRENRAKCSDHREKTGPLRSSFANGMGRHAVALAMLLLCTDRTALGGEWLESGRLAVAEIRTLCERVSDVRQLARMQMISIGNARWRWLSRQDLVIEAAVMGVPPLNPNRCYVIARAGRNDGERRAFEVRDFAVTPERTSVFIVGRDYDPPPEF